MRRKQTSKIRSLPVQWQMQDCAWISLVNVRQPGAVPPESYFIGLLGLGGSLTACTPPIILTPKTSQKYELKQS